MDRESRIWLGIIVGGIGFCSGNPLGILVGIGCIVFIIYQFVGNSTPTAPAQGGGTTRAQPQTTSGSRSTLTLSYAHGQKQVDDTSFKTLELSTTGVFSYSAVINSPKFTVRMVDKGNSSQKPAHILCVIDHLQAEDSTEFEFNLELDQTFQAGAGSDKPVTFTAIPSDFLVFPYQGNRQIQISLAVRDSLSDRLVANASCIWAANILNPGYLEHEEEESKAFAEGLKLAMCLASVDGKFDDIEVKTIQECGTKWVNALPKERQEARKALFNGALEEATREARAGRWTQLEEASMANLKRASSKSARYEAYETCLHVVKADGVLAPREKELLDRIANELGLDKSTVKILSDKHLLHVKVSHDGSSSSEDMILGITPGMPKEDIRKLLNRLFRQYQGLQAHDKPETRQKAAEWLQMVAAARVRHLS
jgi:tellurite resistance protein